MLASDSWYFPSDFQSESANKYFWSFISIVLLPDVFSMTAHARCVSREVQDPVLQKKTLKIYFNSVCGSCSCKVGSTWLFIIADPFAEIGIALLINIISVQKFVILTMLHTICSK